MGVIASNTQTRWRDDFATSAVVRLTLRTNGEEEPSVIRPDGQMYPSGIPAPLATQDPTLVLSAGGTLAANTYYSYRYVYASTQYPFIKNAQTVADGELWPRGNPSDAAQLTTTANRTITVTVTKSTRSDLDKILVYRTAGSTSATTDATEAAAGQMYWIGTIENDGIVGTESLTDNGLTATDELLETDNYTPDCGWFCDFDGTYFWMVGSPALNVPVTVNGSNSVTMTSGKIFDGRDGQPVKFDGITTGGADGKGTYYVGVTSATTFTTYLNPDLTTTGTVNYSGTTTARIQGKSALLFRSKPFNPLSWGFTETILNDDGSTTLVPQSFALELGGGDATALAVVANGKLLKVDFENPQRTITLDLQFADSDQFGLTQQIIDDTGSVTANFSQFSGYLGENPVVFGLDTYNGNVVACDGNRQVIVSDILGAFLGQLDRTDDAFRFFHGMYDPETECNCFWVRYYDTADRLNVLIWMHAPTGEWGWTPDFDVNTSWLVLDSTTNERFIVGGTSYGLIGRLFNPTYFDNWMGGLPWRNICIVGNPTYSAPNYSFSVNANQIGFSQTISSYSFLPGFFVLSATPYTIAGDTVYATGGSPAPEVLVLSVDAANKKVYTADFGEPAPTLTELFVDGSRLDGTWSIIYEVNGTNFWWVQLTCTQSAPGFNDYIFRVDYYIERGTTTVRQNDGDSVPPWSTGALVYFGGYPCMARTYLNLALPADLKSPLELWATALNTDGHAGSSSEVVLTGRQYLEYDETSTAARTFPMYQDARAQDSTANSAAWRSKTGLSSLPERFMGIELCEVGMLAFTLLDFELQFKDNG